MEMDRGENIVLMGENLGAHGGTHLINIGLIDQYGPHRVIDTPISELGFTGATVDMAMMGMRFSVEIMTWNFSFLATDQNIQNAAKVRYFSGGKVKMPMAIRGPNGGVQLSAQHTHSMENLYGHYRRLKVVAPVMPNDVKDLMLTAVRGDNCVIFLEAGGLYGKKGEVEEGDNAIPLGEDRVARKSSEGTLIAYGQQANLCLRAADTLAEEDDVDAEVIDIRSIRPFDEDTIVESIEKTHRAVAVQEQWRWLGVASEVAAIIQDRVFDSLDALVEGVSGAKVLAPYAQNLELAAFPSEKAVANAARRVLYMEEK